MNHVGLALKENEAGIPDLYLDDSGHLALVHDAEAVGQHVSQRLKTFEGEWFLDTQAGVPWLTEIMGKAYDPVLAETVMKAEIIDSVGVVEITSFSTRFDRNTRNLEAFSISLTTVYDEEREITI